MFIRLVTVQKDKDRHVTKNMVVIVIDHLNACDTFEYLSNILLFVTNVTKHGSVAGVAMYRYSTVEAVQ